MVADLADFYDDKQSNAEMQKYQEAQELLDRKHLPLFVSTRNVFLRLIIFYVYSGNLINVHFNGLYCGIIIVRGPMFIAFVGNPCPWIYFPQTYTIICLIFIKIILITLPTKLPPHEPEKDWLPKNIDPHK